MSGDIDVLNRISGENTEVPCFEKAKLHVDTHPASLLLRNIVHYLRVGG